MKKMIIFILTAILFSGCMTGRSQKYAISLLKVKGNSWQNVTRKEKEEKHRKMVAVFDSFILKDLPGYMQVTFVFCFAVLSGDLAVIEKDGSGIVAFTLKQNIQRYVAAIKYGTYTCRAKDFLRLNPAVSEFQYFGVKRLCNQHKDYLKSFAKVLRLLKRLSDLRKKRQKRRKR